MTATAFPHGFQFNPLQVDPESGPGILKVGTYPVRIKEVGIKATKSNANAGMMVLTLETSDGSTGAYRLNVWSDSEQARGIALKQLSALCHCAGFLQPLADPRQLIGLMFAVVVEMQKDSDKYTEVVAVRDMANQPAQFGKPGNTTAVWVPINSAAPVNVPTGQAAAPAPVAAPVPAPAPAAAFGGAAASPAPAGGFGGAAAPAPAAAGPFGGAAAAPAPAGGFGAAAGQVAPGAIPFGQGGFGR